MGCCFSRLFGEELYKDWDSHPAAKQYQLQKRLGEGAFSEVHLAVDTHSGAAVALKVVFLCRPGLKAQERAILAREAHLLRMVNHPHIVRCFQVLETPRQQVLVLERLTGGDLLDHLQSLSHYTEQAACTIFTQVVAAVAYLHALGILHRDIKPENILLAKPLEHYAARQRSIKVKLIDLGMAGVTTPGRPCRGCMGSPGFIAPEVVRGGIHRPSMDVYSLGVLLFVMLCGRKPWDPQQAHTLKYAAQSLDTAPGLKDPRFTSLSPEAQQLLLALLSDKPKDRPTAAEVLRHPWVTSVTAAGAAKGQRVIGRSVQQRLQVLANNRRVMGTARGLLMVAGGSQSAVAAYQAAVAQAQAQLQQQAGALLTGKVPLVLPDHMPPRASAGAGAAAGGEVGEGSRPPAGVKAVSDGVLLPPPERVGVPAAAVGVGGLGAAAGAATEGGRRRSAPGSSAVGAGTGTGPQPTTTTSSSSRQRLVVSTDGNSARGTATPPEAVGLGRRSVGLGGLIRAAQLQQQQQQQQQLGGSGTAATSSASSSSGLGVGQGTANARQGKQALLSKPLVAGAAGRAQGHPYQQQQEEGEGQVSSRGVGGMAIPQQQQVLRRGLSGPVLRQLAVSMFNDTGVWGHQGAPVKAMSLSPGALALLEAEEAALLLGAAAASGSLNSSGPLGELLAAAAAGGRGRDSSGGGAGGAGDPGAAAGAVEVPGGRRGAGGGEEGVAAWSPRAALADMLASYRERRALHKALICLHQASEDEEGPAGLPKPGAAGGPTAPCDGDADGPLGRFPSPPADEHTHLLASSRGDSAAGGAGLEAGPGCVLLEAAAAGPAANVVAAGNVRHSTDPLGVGSAAAAAAPTAVVAPPAVSTAQPLSPSGLPRPPSVEGTGRQEPGPPSHHLLHHQQQQQVQALSPAASLQHRPTAGSLGSSYSYADILLMEGLGSCEEGAGPRLLLSGADSMEAAGAEAGLVAAAATAAADGGVPLQHQHQYPQQQREGAAGRVRLGPLGVPVAVGARQGHSLAPSLPTIVSRPPSRNDLGPSAAGGDGGGSDALLDGDRSSPAATSSSTSSTSPPAHSAAPQNKRPQARGNEAAAVATQRDVAAVLAAAAAAEEAGGVWPTGLWLQQPRDPQQAVGALDLAAGFSGAAGMGGGAAAVVVDLERSETSSAAAELAPEADGASLREGDLDQPVSPRSPRPLKLLQQAHAGASGYLEEGATEAEQEEEGPSGLTTLPELLQQQQAAAGGWRQRRGQQAGGRGGQHSRYPSDLQHWLSGSSDLPPAVAGAEGAAAGMSAGPVEVGAAVGEAGTQPALHTAAAATAAAAAGHGAKGTTGLGGIGADHATPTRAAAAAAEVQGILVVGQSASSRAMERHISIRGGRRGVSFLSRSSSADADSQLYVGSYNQTIHSMAVGAGGGLRAGALTSQPSDGGSEMTSPGDTSLHMRRHLREMSRAPSDAYDGLFAGAAAAVLGASTLSPAASGVTELTEASDDWNDPSLRASEPGVTTPPPAAAAAGVAHAPAGAHTHAAHAKQQHSHHSSVPSGRIAGGFAAIPAHRPAAAAADVGPRAAAAVGLSAQVAAVGASGARGVPGPAAGRLGMEGGISNSAGPSSRAPGYGSGVIPGATAWLTRSLSGKYDMLEGEGLTEAEGEGEGRGAAADSRVGARGGGLAAAGAAPAATGSAAVFDDMDDTLWYYAS